MLIKLNLFISRECDNRKTRGYLLAIIVNLLLVALHIVADEYGPRSTFILVDANHIHRLTDPTNDETPTFIIRQTICNYKENPIQIYSFEKKIKPAEKFKPDVKIEYKLLGELDDKFSINILDTHFRGTEEFQSVELVLNESLEIHELLLQLDAVRTETSGTVVNSQKVCEIKFRLTVEDCNSITWQTLTVIILASLSVLLFSTLAIMFSLYQQKDINSNKDSDELDNDDLDTFNECHGDDASKLGDKRGTSSFDYNNNDGNEDSSYNLHNTNMFINPRRTSSYDSSNFSRYSNSDVIDLNETQL